MRDKVTLALVLAACAVSAQGQSNPSSALSSTSERAYQAIRNNDLTSLRVVVKEAGVDHKDSLGQTPLILAAAFGSPEAVEFLLASGADPKAASNAGLTALHASRGEAKIVRLLLSRGADAKARTQLGKTPLIVAASSSGAEEAVRLLIERGADVNEADSTGFTPLMGAARADDTSIARVLIEKGADAAAVAAGVGQSSTALMAAAYNGNAELVRLLLAHGAKLDPVSRDYTEVVKNGRVAFGRVTALHMGTASGNAEVVKLLLDAGAAVDPQDIRGMTPLMWALSNDHPNALIVRLLLEKAANTSLKSNAGESSVDWARKYNHPAVLAELKLQPDDHKAQLPAPGASHGIDQIRQSVERSMPLLRTASARLLSDGGCVACHAQPMTAMAIDLARSRGWRAESPEQEVSDILARVSVDTTGLLQVRDGGGLPDTHLYNMIGMAALKVPPRPATDALLYYLAAKQTRQGNWHGLGAIRPPLQDGDIVRTAMSVRALTVYRTPAREAEFARRIELAARWLSLQTPVTTADRAMQLLGLKWAEAHARRREALARELKALQRGDGGWAQTPHLASDAYATSQVLYALREMGTAPTDAAMRRGIEFLLRTQREDGSWYVKSRAAKVQPYFESGFPHGHDQWISHAASAWAVMALSMMAPETPVTTSAAR
jgi:ankyrin repeat protein